MDSFRSKSKYFLTLWLLLSCLDSGNSQTGCPDWDPTIMSCSTGFTFSYATCTCVKGTTAKTTTKTLTKTTTTTPDPRKALEPRITALIGSLTALQSTVNLAVVQDQACKNTILANLPLYIASAKQLQTNILSIPYNQGLTTLTTLEGNLVSIRNDWTICQAKTTTTTTTPDPRSVLTPRISTLLSNLTSLQTTVTSTAVQDETCKNSILSSLASIIANVQALKLNLYNLPYNQGLTTLTTLEGNLVSIRNDWTICQAKTTSTTTTTTTEDPRNSLLTEIATLLDDLAQLKFSTDSIVQDQTCKDTILANLLSQIDSVRQLQANLYRTSYSDALNKLNNLKDSFGSTSLQWTECETRTTTTEATTTVESSSSASSSVSSELLFQHFSILINSVQEFKATVTSDSDRNEDCKQRILSMLEDLLARLNSDRSSIPFLEPREGDSRLVQKTIEFYAIKAEWENCIMSSRFLSSSDSPSSAGSSSYSSFESSSSAPSSESSSSFSSSEGSSSAPSSESSSTSESSVPSSESSSESSAPSSESPSSESSSTSESSASSESSATSPSSEGPSTSESSASSESSATSSESPSSESPSSESPSSESPSSESPSSESPSSESPSSESPSSESPSSESPSSESPSSESSSSESPTSEPPNSEPPSAIVPGSLIITPWWTSTSEPLVCKPPKISYCFPTGPCTFWNPQRMHCPDHYNFNTDYCSCMPDYNYFSLPNCGNACDCYEYLNLTTCRCMCTPVNCTEFGKIWNQEKCECEAVPAQLPPTTEKPVCSIPSCRPCDRLDMLNCTCERREVTCPPKYEPVDDGCKCIKSNETSPLCPGLICMNGPSINEARCSCTLKSCNGTCPTGYVMDLDTCECACGLKEWQCPTETPFLDDFNCQCIRPICDLISPCPDDTKWNSDTCRCECIDPPTCPLNNFVLDLPTCQCVCINETCPPGHILDELACICVPDPDPSCPNKLTYDHDKCECVCAPESRTCEYGLQWDENECDCICVKNEVCLDQFIWDQDKCQCVCNATIISTLCHANQTFDYLKCQCIDNPIPSCQRGFVYNSTLCDCVCAETKLCVGGNVFDPDSCDCVCPEVTECAAGMEFNIDLCQCVFKSVSSSMTSTFSSMISSSISRSSPSRS